jgi:iron-sulfur cluster assembly protein
MPVNVTETAVRKIAEIIKDQELNPETVYLRVGVKGGGCSGFNYILDLTEAKKDTDEVWEYTYDVPVGGSAADELADIERSAAQGGESSNRTAVAEPRQMEKFTLRVVCDPKSYLYLNGTSIDYKTDGMLHSGFAFNNPNATSSCGCGSSFSA